MLLVHGLADRGFLPRIGDTESTELSFLFFLSTMLFFLFFIRDRQARLLAKELETRRKESSRLGKELAASYSYIGEVNRKFEILQDVSLEIPEILENHKNSKRKKDIFFDVLHAVQVFSGCGDFVVTFSEEKTPAKKTTELFLPSSRLKGIPKNVNIEAFASDDERFTQSEGRYQLIKANGTIGGIRCIAIFRRSALRVDTVDIVRPLLMQVLFLYAHTLKTHE